MYYARLESALRELVGWTGTQCAGDEHHPVAKALAVLDGESGWMPINKDARRGKPILAMVKPRTGRSDIEAPDRGRAAVSGSAKQTVLYYEPALSAPWRCIDGGGGYTDADVLGWQHLPEIKN